MPPENSYGAITKYSIQYGGNVVDNFGSVTLNKIVGTVEGLSPDTEYILQLKAHTKVGPGPPASLSVKTCKLLILQYINLVISFYYHTLCCTFVYHFSNTNEICKILSLV